MPEVETEIRLRLSEETDQGKSAERRSYCCVWLLLPDSRSVSARDPSTLHPPRTRAALCYSSHHPCVSLSWTSAEVTASQPSGRKHYPSVEALSSLRNRLKTETCAHLTSVAMLDSVPIPSWKLPLFLHKETEDSELFVHK
uniref:Uncharacterized protein n=1 Tax=Branchiostoma floridae TaxID=7739 RepID=C3Y147_BRAFL|eukprot:XP_002609577.1 hypothetical protein BRAFLDRAFT_87782 [Branchiostoma floridae]